MGRVLREIGARLGAVLLLLVAVPLTLAVGKARTYRLMSRMMVAVARLVWYAAVFRANLRAARIDARGQRLPRAKVPRSARLMAGLLLFPGALPKSLGMLDLFMSFCALVLVARVAGGTGKGLRVRTAWRARGWRKKRWQGYW